MKKEVIGKDGKKYIVFTVKCKQCSETFSYFKLKNTKTGKPRLLCDYCKWYNKQLRNKKTNNDEHTVETKKDWWNRNRDRYNRNWVSKLGGQLITNEDIKNWTGKTLGNSSFKHTNEAMNSGSNKKSWYEEITRCPICNGYFDIDKCRDELVCKKCGFTACCVDDIEDNKSKRKEEKKDESDRYKEYYGEWNAT